VALVRYALLEMGKRMTQRKMMERSDDVFYLEMDELLRAFRGGKDVRGLAPVRRAERDEQRKHPGPASYGEQAPMDFGAMPHDIQMTIMGMLWVVDQYSGREKLRKTTESAVLEGSGASRGQYTGPVCIIKDESEFHKLHAGDVLVCTITSPSWTILFPKVGALITDVGGVLSHPAIIAREYGVPAVVATGRATTSLRDGQVVTVDGSTGMIEVLTRNV
jgi:pyruvate,water dikinase